jgi:hypothetical protein
MDLIRRLTGRDDISQICVEKAGFSLSLARRRARGA